MDEPKRRAGDSWVIVVLRLVVAAVAAVAATWGAATRAGLWAAGGGAVLGVLLGEIIGRTRARLTLGALVALALAGLGGAGWSLMTRWGTVAAALGPGETIASADAVMLAGLAAGICLALRVTGARFKAAAAIELAFYAAALAAPLAAHRGGAINRPLAIGDYAWSMGQDPVIYLQIAGGVAAVGLSLFLITERRWIRALAAAVLVLLASVSMGVLASFVAPPTIRTDAGLGLTGRAQEEGAEGRNKGARSLDQLDFRDNYGSKQRQAPVAVVLLHDDYEPPSKAYYLRQNAFSRYNGTRMVPAFDADVDQDIFPLFPSAKRRAGWVPPPAFRIPVKTTVALLQDHINPVVLEAPETVAPAKNPSPRRFRRAYNATSLALDVPIVELIGNPVGDPSWSDAVKRLYLEAPEDPRYREMADQFVKLLPAELQGDPVARAAVIADELGRRGTYSLRSKHAGAADPTASFLFGDVTGYCVYFAHAAVFLFRTAGVPSRLATGYQYPAKQRGRGSSLLIRGSDAHAWPEIYVEGAGWVVVDVSPARNLEPPGIPLDPELQRMLGEMLRGQLEDQRRANLEIGEAPLGMSQVIDVVLAILIMVLRVLPVVLLGFFFGKNYVRLISPLAASAEDQARCSYRAALVRLSDVGFRRRHGEPPERFALRLAEVTPSLQALTIAALARKLGSKAPADPGAAKELSQKVLKEIRRAVPWWRRALGEINPFTWLLVR